VTFCSSFENTLSIGLVQKCIKSRSSTQARSHAQKFLLKLRKKLKIEPDSTNKLSKESIDKIIKEIVDSSSFRHHVNVDKDKLIKLIMGFSNLLVGRSMSPATNTFDYNYSLNNENYCDGIFTSEGKKVFHIEKVFKSDRRYSNTYSTADSQYSFQTPCSDKTDKPSYQVNQISNQNDLLKYLLQSAPQTQDPTNPNKNVINIISINICNKNEGENNIVNNNVTTSSLPALLQNSAVLQANPNLKKSLSLQNNITNVKSIPMMIKHEPKSSNNISRDVAIPVLRKDLINKSVNKAVCSSASTCNLDFYENSSSNTYFNQKNVEEDIDKFFDWN